MSNTLLTAWVKNVYSLRITSGIYYGYKSVSYTPPTLPTTQLVVQTPIFTQVLAMFSAVLPTQNIAQIPLLISQLYPVSTAPTIKRMKEKMERNS